VMAPTIAREESAFTLYACRIGTRAYDSSRRGSPPLRKARTSSHSQRPQGTLATNSRRITSSDTPRTAAPSPRTCIAWEYLLSLAPAPNTSASTRSRDTSQTSLGFSDHN